MLGAGGGGHWADMKGLTLQVRTGRRFMMFAALLITNTAGLSYIFCLYSNEIRLQLYGVLHDMAKRDWKNRQAPYLANVLLYICLGSNSQSFVNTGALVTCIKNFPESRGLVIGVLKGYSGLNGAVITQMYHAIYGDDAKSLILLIAWLPVVLCLVFLRTMRIMKAPRQPNEVKLFYSFLYISLCLAGYLMVIIIVEKRVNFTQSEYGVSAAMVLFLLFLPLAVVIMDEFKLWKSKKEARNDPSPLKVTTLEATSYETSTISVLTEPSAQNKPISCWKTAFQPPDRGEDYTILQALFSIDMFAYILCYNLWPWRNFNGNRQLGPDWNFLRISQTKPVASPIGSYLLNMRVAGHLYDKEAEKQLAALGLTRKAGKDLNCSGVECFKLSFIIITAMIFTWHTCFAHFGAKD
uniref:Nodulin-like domain-containing protein n=1 Tax=Fagus sylvatica TaxID=28930 RepID=A0A2N9I952_FAGSY